MASFAQLAPAVQDELRGAGGVGWTLGGRSTEGSGEQGAGLEVGLAEADADLEAGSPDEPLDHVGGRGAGSGLDAGDGRLRYGGPVAQLGLREPGPPARFADEITEDHGSLYSLLAIIGYSGRNGWARGLFVGSMNETALPALAAPGPRGKRRASSPVRTVIECAVKGAIPQRVRIPPGNCRSSR